MKAQSLSGSLWQLHNIDNIETGKSNVIDKEVKLSLMFDSDSVYSGIACTSYKGKYNAVDNKKISMRKADAVTPTCLGISVLQKEVLEMYLKVTRYRVDNGKLFLFTSDDHRMVFHKK